MKKEARWTVQITDNLKGKIDKFDTNVLMGGLKRFGGDEAYKFKYINESTDADIKITLAATFTALREICLSCGLKDAYKAILEIALEDVNAKQEESEWSN